MSNLAFRQNRASVAEELAGAPTAAVEQSALGPKFRDAATELLERYGCKYYIKEDLRKAS